MRSLASFLKTMEDLKNKKVIIGIHGEAGEQKKVQRLVSAKQRLKKGQKRFGISETLTVETVAKYLIDGTKRMEARPFILQPFNKNKKEIYAFLKKNIKKNPEICLEKTGLFVEGLIKKSIKNKEYAENKTKTIERKFKKSKKVISSTPLVDTGQLINSITFKVIST